MQSHLEGKISEIEFKEFYQQYYPIVYKVGLYLLKVEERAEDVAQDIFLKLWNNPMFISEAKNIKSYLISMTRNLALDALKKQKKESDQVLYLEPTFIIEHEDETVEQGFRKALEAAVSQLPPKCRLIFSLSRFEGLSNEEIAEYLEISKRTVETQISIALKAFRGDLRPLFEPYLAHLGVAYLSFFIQQL